jgi:acid phosphatase type 7
MTRIAWKPVLAASAVLAAGAALVAFRPWADDATAQDGLGTTSTGVATILAVGDIGRCDEQVDEATAAIVEAFPESTLLVLGDVAYNSGTRENFDQCYDPSWGQFLDRTRPVPGNHEYRTDGATPYFDYFGSSAGERGKGWYSVQLGEWLVVALNSNCDQVDCGAGSEQERWLRSQLESSDARCTLAFAHHPRFSSGEHGGTNDIADLWQALLDHDAELLLSGHDHNYERTAPLDADGTVDPTSGVRQFVVGTGGGNFRAIGARIQGSEAAQANTGGVLSMTLHPDGYDWKFLPVGSGDALDTGSAACR